MKSLEQLQRKRKELIDEYNTIRGFMAGSPIIVLNGKSVYSDEVLMAVIRRDMICQAIAQIDQKIKEVKDVEIREKSLV